MLSQTLLIRKKQKPAGQIFLDAVQFMGDPGVHPQIFWDTSPGSKPHWRIGGEGHGGPYDSGSSCLEHGVWIVGEGATLALIRPDELERDWQVVERSWQVSAADARADRLQEAKQKLLEALAIMDALPAPYEAFEQHARERIVAGLDNLRAAQHELNSKG